jgi:hypothetical protein
MVLLENVVSSAAISFAPTLYALLNSATPPTLACFKKLPTGSSKRWAVYLLVLEHPDEPFRIYVGSATNFLNGVLARFNNYRKGDLLPVYVEEALDEGFTISHYGLLCTMAIPPALLVYPLRTLFKALEAAFTYALGALIPSSHHHDLSHLCLWKLDDLE